MSGFDLVIVGLVALSALLAFVRGIVRSLIGLLAWVAGLVAAVLFAPALAVALPSFQDYPLLPYAMAFVLIFLVAIVAGALIAWPIATIVRKAGLGFVDRGLGAVFGVARGVLVVLVFVLLAGFSGLPEREWWQNSLFVPPFERAALAVARWLPPAWAERLRYPERTDGAALRKA
jgi:membrane protein required for colicin V production